MITFLQLKQKLRTVLWPAGEAQQLRVPHDGFFKEAMMELQKSVECLRQHNVTQFAFANTYWHNGRTVVNAPFGEVRKVYTIANSDFTDPVLYRSVDWDEMECWAKRLWEAPLPNVTVGQELTLGYRVADASSDSTFGRGRIGAWCIYRQRLYLAPWIQSNETIIVDWDGEKNDWADTDGIDDAYWTIDVEAAITLYVAYKHEVFYGDKAEAKKFKDLWQEALADLIWKCREYTRQKPDQTCDAGADGQLTGLTQDRLDDDSDDEEEEEQEEEDNVLFAQIADIGELEDADGLALSAAVEADNPEALILAGDISYTGDYEEDFAAKYQWALDAGVVVPGVGNHDQDVLSAYLAFFDEQVDGKTHTEFTIGSCHFFLYNSDPREADGINSSSVQAGWLRAKMLLSTARWKIVVLHHPPYSSGSTHGSTPAVQLDFATWGADLVISGHEHNYERIIDPTTGLTYIVNGLGARSQYAFTTPVTGSQIRYNTKYGRLIGEANCDRLILTFKNIDGETVDTVTLTKD